MSTLRISNIEAKSVPASATIDEKVKITNSSGDPLVFIDGKTSGITTVGINTTDPNITFDANSNVVVTGIITATKFSGEFEPTSVGIADSIFHTGDTDTSINFPAADTITLDTAGTERLRIDSSGQLGIGTNSPKLLLHLHQQNSNATFAHFTNTTTGINANQGVSFGLDSNEDATIYHYGSKAIRFATSGTEKVRIDSIGRLLINRTSAYASSSERLSINGMTSMQGSSTSTPPLYIFNTDTTGSGTIQPFLYLHDGSGIRGGHGLQYSTGNYIINGQSAIQFRTGATGIGGSEKVRITNVGSVGIGTNNPTDILDINSDSASAVTNMYLRNHANLGGAALNIWTQGTYASPQYKAIIGCSDAGGNIRMGAHSNHELLLLTNNTPRVTVKTSGDVEIADGNLIVASGHGIDFSANGNAGGMTSELLDIYEEGSWTPYIYPMSSNIPVTYSHQSGRYTRIGNVVHFQFKLQVSNITGNRNQGFGINGFPFNNTGSQDQVSSEFYGETWSGEIPTTIKWIGNTNRGVCYFYTGSQHYQSSSMLDINVSSSMLMGSGHYLTHV